MSNFRIRALQEFSTRRAERFFEENRPVSRIFRTECIYPRAYAQISFA